MGTSASYSAPPSWGELKAQVTRAASTGSASQDSALKILGSHIRHNGGARAIARGESRCGGIVGSGRAARTVAGRLGNFIADVGTYGFNEALRRVGLVNFIGRPVQEVLNALLDNLGGPASTIDDVDARTALSKLQDKMLENAADAADVERILTAQATQLESVLQDFFGFYLFEQFCRVFFERLVQRVGETRAHSFLSDIEDFVRSTLANRTVGLELAGVDWAGPEGQAIISNIMETTLTVFGG
jgi:hypothetical protein